MMNNAKPTFSKSLSFEILKRKHLDRIKNIGKEVCSHRTEGRKAEHSDCFDNCVAITLLEHTIRQMGVMYQSVL